MKFNAKLTYLKVHWKKKHVEAVLLQLDKTTALVLANDESKNNVACFPRSFF